MNLVYKIVTFSHIKHQLYANYNIDCHDYNNCGTYFDKWCDKKGYGLVDPDGKYRNSSQIWYKEYKKDPEGYASVPAYLNFNHWIHDMLVLYTNNEDPLSKPIEISIDELKELHLATAKKDTIKAMSYIASIAENPDTLEIMKEQLLQDLKKYIEIEKGWDEGNWLSIIFKAIEEICSDYITPNNTLIIDF